MPDDWSWFFASEHGRDRMLREEIEGLQASAASAYSESARLSSQLRTLQASLETRLQALSGVRSRTSATITDATATAQRVARACREDQAEAATLVRAITGDRVPAPLLVD
jgi:chromosome segregation ATPase